MNAYLASPGIEARVEDGAGDRLFPGGDILAGDFFTRSSEVVAPELIGKVLWRPGVGGGRLTEVEAYLPEDDPACHTACGMTRRNAAMFGPPGSVYVYLSYGIHVLLNLVCDREHVGSAVLIRAFEPVGDTRQLERNRAGNGRPTSPGEPSERRAKPEAAYQGPRLSCGPGRVGQALGLDLGVNGLPLGEASSLYVIDDGLVPKVDRTARIGISKGDRLLLRFSMSGSAYVSRSRPSGGRKE
jgi:DNA-3-methyladenine glycosylase